MASYSAESDGPASPTSAAITPTPATGKERRYDVDDGKYTLILAADGYTVTALRYGQPWREFVGDKFISLLVQDFFEVLDEA